MITNQLRGKKVLFLSVRTFNLENEIIRKLESFGAYVTYFDERPNNNNFTKAIIRVKKSLYQVRINSYYQNILKTIENENYDFLFVNKGEVVPEFFLQEFNKQNPACTKLFYCWDSFDNNPHALKNLVYFDRKSSFDPLDAKKYNIYFRPLFFLDEYENLEMGKEVLDLLFIGTAHSDRYIISSKIKNWCQQNKLKAFCFYYMQGKFVYFYKRFFDKTFKQFDYKKLSFKSLSKVQILDYYQKSKVILDINHPYQRGLTLRTFEALGAKKKIITTNQEIKKFPFYNENNVFVIDRTNIRLNKSFFETPYQKVDKETYKKFSLEGFLYNIFINPEQDYWNKSL
ncbi:lipopolysaccharide biosynthesis protein [Elizabethkingia anophelis]|uniref:Lipopolysaccharide biosynthesis protein n=2 Tax=Elizabethkingia TaxID=308865 RepID=A0A7Z7LV65_9FLAO|nr:MULTISPECIES: lipopolysaccharide biosynthesis protein [Elizabethkingia]MCT3630523.1 lipopolysaccharide biosynthesis protein [Elizabethkingia anophelis]MCT3633968.1 lipopolysaccharide biosynthesis protein [Elizabethkingia anophelis]MCT3692012.1 lipopolysaccharide biosynthesis protein [Elizabethkingia anophelis]MCT3764154.1 lipopolysaccharide biosynthesis protein [Elizabethkingia anophelis]MCT3823478.1 lipopolysaccharide biosynthesis protein [Elizabethkingia anophelis]